MLDYIPKMSHQLTYTLIMVEKFFFLAIIYSNIFLPKINNPNHQISLPELPEDVQLVPSLLTSNPYVKLE